MTAQTIEVLVIVGIPVAIAGYVFYKGAGNVAQDIAQTIGDVAVNTATGLVKGTGNAAITAVEDAGKSVVQASDKATGGFATKALDAFGVAPTSSGSFLQKAGRGLEASFLVNPLTGPFIAVGAGLNAAFNKKTQQKLKDCGKESGWSRFQCGAKTFFGFQ